MFFMLFPSPAECALPRHFARLLLKCLTTEATVVDRPALSWKDLMVLLVSRALLVISAGKEFGVYARGGLGR